MSANKRRRKDNQSEPVQSLTSRAQDKSAPDDPAFGCLRAVALIALGAILSPFIQDKLARNLPGPLIEVFVSKVTEQHKFTAYSLQIRTDETLEDLDAKIQFRNLIFDSQVGYPGEVEDVNGRKGKGQLWIVATNSIGRPYIDGTAVTNNLHVQSALAGHTLSVHASRLASNDLIMGIVITESDRAETSPLKMFSEGTYRYRKLGLELEKPFKIEGFPRTNWVRSTTECLKKKGSFFRVRCEKVEG